MLWPPNQTNSQRKDCLEQVRQIRAAYGPLQLLGEGADRDSPAEAVAARERRAQLVCLTSCLSAVILLANSVSVTLCLFVHISPP